nr:TPA_asm: m17.5 sORF 3 [Murid betaherpesvirus 1]DBA07729.1 TPA_asm: m17.5 sORF 3 [Murid betaherpesvirus 1]
MTTDGRPSRHRRGRRRRFVVAPQAIWEAFSSSEECAAA